jgi:acetyl-CoA carboxylase carboxyl transferase subunit alpha
MKITAPDLKGFGLIDEIVPEPLGGAQADPATLFATLDQILTAQLRELTALSPAALLEGRYQKFRRMGHAGAEFLESP